jgi:hypothetical protein
MNVNPLEPRDTPTNLSLTFTGDWWTDARRAVAEAVAAEVSAKIDMPGHDVWRVELIAVPTYPLIAEATGTDGWGRVWVGPAAAAQPYDELLRAGGLIVVVPAAKRCRRPPCRSRRPKRPRTRKRPRIAAPSCGSALWGGWAHVPPRVAADWGLS